MFHLAAGVCLGIVAAVFLLNWLTNLGIRLGKWQARRTMRRLEKARRREHEARLRAYQASVRPALRPAAQREGLSWTEVMLPFAVVLAAWMVLVLVAVLK